MKYKLITSVVLLSIIHHGSIVYSSNVAFAGDSPLCEASSKNDYDTVKALIEQNTNSVNKLCEDKYGATPLHLASLSLAYESAELLIEHGANVNSRFIAGGNWNKRVNGSTPMHFALNAANPNIKELEEIVTLLLKAGANKDLKNGKGETVLDIATKNRISADEWKLAGLSTVTNYSSIIEIINKPLRIIPNPETNSYKNKKVDLLSKLPSKKRERIISCIERDDISCFKSYLTEISADATTSKNGEPLIHIAAEHNSMKILKLLLDKGVDINITTSQYTKSMLSGAAFESNLKMINYLIEQGADVNKEERENKCTSLFFLMSKHKNYRTPNDIKIANILLSKGVNPNARCGMFGNTPLHEAVENNLLEMIKLLLSKGADANIKNNFDSSSIFRVKSEEAIKLLVQAGANINELNKDGESATKVALKYGEKDKVKVLKKHGGVVINKKTIE